MKTAIAQFDWSLFVECPNCEKDLDLVDMNDEGCFSVPIFNNKWDNLMGHEVVCPSCKNIFALEKVEY